LEKRRKYLWNKAVLRSKVIGNSVWLLIWLVATVGCAVVVCMAHWLPYATRLWLAGVTWLLAFQTHWTYRFMRQSRREEVALLFVPPVREQIEALPLETLLLRGSYQPAITSNDLLRAAHNGPKTASEELLRPNENVATRTGRKKE
jgi:hypothetical protein